MKLFRYLIFIAGLLTLLLALGFVFRVPIATNLWPWPDGRYSYLFIGSILAAACVAMLWIGWTGLFAALPAGALNIFVIAFSTDIYFFWLALGQGRSNLIPYGLASLLTAIASGRAFLWSRRLSLNDLVLPLYSCGSLLGFLSFPCSSRVAHYSSGRRSFPGI